MIKRTEITRFVNDIKRTWGTNDPFEIAERFGIVVNILPSCLPDFTAHTLKREGYPTIISINSAYDELSRKILCAHELGHALLHSEGINHYTIASSVELEIVEAEANVFALMLLDDSINRRVNMPIERMSNYILKSIIDYNLRKM